MTQTGDTTTPEEPRKFGTLGEALDDLADRRRFEVDDLEAVAPDDPERPAKFSADGWEETKTLRKWLAGETVEGPELLTELNFWRSYLGGDVVAPEPEPEPVELRPGVHRLKSLPADAVHELDVDYGPGERVTFWRSGELLIVRALNGDLVSIDPAVVIP